MIDCQLADRQDVVNIQTGEALIALIEGPQAVGTRDVGVAVSSQHVADAKQH